jgi:hypothetical protein
MNFTKVMVCNLLLVVGLVTNQVQASDIRDEQGRTSEMNFIRSQEMSVDIIQKDKARLWDRCYEHAKVKDGSVKYKMDGDTTRSYNTYRTELRRRPSCLDSDVQAHRQREQDLTELISDTIASLQVKAEQPGVSFAAQDNSGYTILNYCYTEEFYNELRRLGAPFQLVPWAYFNPAMATCATIATVGVVMSAYYYIANKFRNKDIENKLNDRAIK